MFGSTTETLLAPSLPQIAQLLDPNNKTLAEAPVPPPPPPPPPSSNPALAAAAAAAAFAGYEPAHGSFFYLPGGKATGAHAASFSGAKAPAGSQAGTSESPFAMMTTRFVFLYIVL